jgi:hypothetical protein
VSIGLTPAKSLTLGPLEIPGEYSADFFRGCIDTDRHHAAKCERDVYERLDLGSRLGESRVHRVGATLGCPRCKNDTLEATVECRPRRAVLGVARASTPWRPGRPRIMPVYY